MGDMADEALDRLADCDEYQMRTIGRSTVYSGGRPPRGTMNPPPCSVCSGAMVVRNGPHGPFWGCGNFPRCKGGKTYAAQEPSMAGQSAFSEEEEVALELGIELE